MHVVSNTSPISELYKVGRLNLLNTVYGDIHIPSAVFQELEQAQTLPGLADAVHQATWIHIHTLSSLIKPHELQRRYAGIHRGEAAAIALAQAFGAQRMILDDKRARQAAQAEGRAVQC